MKKIILSIFIALAVLQCQAQLNNTDFETWNNYTSIWGYDTYVPVDTFTYNNPDGWTSTNSATGNTALGGLYYVSQSNDAQNGNSAIRMETGEVSLQGVISLILPAFIANGSFYMDLGSAIGGGGQLSPMALVGAGTPVSTRKEKISVYVKYEPVASDSLNDSLLVWAVLKGNGNLVAEARVAHGTTNGNYQLVEADFKYVGCDDPDTMVVMISSSIPDFTGLLGGNSGLEPGSVLLVDNISVTDIPGNFNLPPVAMMDETFTLNSATKKVAVLDNDSDCENDPLTVSIPFQPLHGTATVITGDTVLYTPDNGFLGVDTIVYSLSDGNSTSNSFIRMSMLGTSSVDETIVKPLVVYPNPAADDVVYFNNNINGMVFNSLGQYIISIKNSNKINIEGWETGVYTLRTENGSISKFLVKQN